MKIPKFFVANDASSREEAIKNVKLLSKVDGDYGIKLNLDLILKERGIIRDVIRISGKPVFADMKMWNGKRTMDKVIKYVADQGAVMVNAYALADSMLDKAVETAKEVGVIILGVTVLTHYTNEYCIKFHRRSLRKTVRLLAETALDRGCDGYILPGTTLSAVKDLSGIKFNPAVRPLCFVDKKANAQEQIMAPGVAIKKGADIVSCGSPIFQSENPAKALEMILEEIESVS
jgi:orotidine-5'-phosphate decarboxylase